MNNEMCVRKRENSEWEKLCHSAYRLMFWSDWGVSGRIESAYMDGTGRRTLVDTMVQWPTGLAIDYPARRLYWTDPKAYTVESVDLNGQDRQVIRRFPQSESGCS
jgi:integrin beta 2